MPELAIGPFHTGEIILFVLTVVLIFTGGMLPRIGNALGRMAGVRPRTPPAAPSSRTTSVPPDDR